MLIPFSFFFWRRQDLSNVRMVCPSQWAYTLGYDDHDSFQLFQLCRFARSSAQHPVSLERVSWSL